MRSPKILDHVMQTAQQPGWKNYHINTG